MKSNVSIGDQKEYRYTVTAHDVAAFHGKIVHPVCATFILAREIEWTTRQFVLDLVDEDEEGVGTFLSIDHKSPAFVGEEIIFTARMDEQNGNEVRCSYTATVNERLVAQGQTGQKILKKEKIKRLFDEAKEGNKK